jgi:hypothetical protein
MDFKQIEIVLDQQATEIQQHQVQQLEEFQLVLVGGGIGETIL